MDVEESFRNLSLDLLNKLSIVLAKNPTKDASQTAWLSSVLYFKFLKTGAMEVLEQAILGVTKGAIPATHIKHPDRARFLKFVVRMLGKKYEHTNSLKDLQTAVRYAKGMVETTPKDHPDGTSQFAAVELITMMLEKYKHFKSEEAPDNVGDRGAGILKDVITSIWQMFQYNPGNMADYAQLVEGWCRELLDVTPDRHPDRGMRLVNLTGALMARFERSSNSKYLDEAIRRSEEALACTSAGHRRRGHILNNLASALLLRFESTRNFYDLERAIRIAKYAMDATTSKENPDRGRVLTTLATVLALRYEQTGRLQDLQDAIDTNTQALACIFHEPDAFSYTLQGLGEKLLLRFRRTRKFDDLEAAIRRAEEAVAATPDGHPCRGQRLGNLGSYFGMKFKVTDSLDDLQICIDTGEAALACTGDGEGDGNWDRASLLATLARSYLLRFNLTLDMDNLEEAIRRSREAVGCTPQGHAKRAYVFLTLAQSLQRRFSRTGLDPKDLDEAVRLCTEAVDSTLDSHCDRGAYLRGWAEILTERFKVTRNLDDLDMAIRRGEESLAVATPVATAEDRFSQLLVLRTLATSLWLRFEHTGNTDDMKRAIERAEEAVAIGPSDHQGRMALLLELGSYLVERSQRCDVPGDYERSLLLWKECMESHNATPRLRIEAGIIAARFLAEDQKWVEASRIADIAVKLLPRISPRALKQRDQQYSVGQFHGFACFAASAALRAGQGASYALELLELGRGIIAGLRFDAWTDLADLRDQHPEMADKFELLRDKMNSPSSSGLDLEAVGDIVRTSHSRVTQRHNDSREFEKIVAEIRDQPNFKHFLHPPQTDQLKAIASSGPVVVINVTEAPYESFCDAFLLDGHTVRTLPLPGLHYSDILKNVRLLRLIRNGKALATSSPRDQLFRMLAWLWDVAAGPVLDELGFRGPPPSNHEWPHVWWIPTGILSSLPLHAAGRHLPESSDAVLDSVVSSYSPSIKALLHARQNSEQEMILNRTFDDILLVSMQTTPGKSELKFAAEEVEVLSHLLSDGPSIPQVKQKPLKQPFKEAVFGRLSTCSVFHFAGHGRSDPLDPSKSSLLLADWQSNPLTVEDLIGLNLHKKSPWLAYLSACSTSENQAKDLLDEAIHLVTACQLAGFQHVVGSLWEVSDRYSVDAARHFYGSIKHGGVTNDGAIAWAAHNAARLLREDTRNRNRRLRQGRPQEEDVAEEIEGSNPLIWAAYVHVGP